jgi:hypothetical protein
MGVSDTAIRNEVFDKKTNPNGCLRASVGINKKNGRPELNYDIAYAEWCKAGRTIKNPEYYPKSKVANDEAVDVLKKEIINNTLKKEQVAPVTNSTPSIGRNSLIFEGMSPFESEAVKGMYDAGLKELAYLKALGSLAPVDRVKMVLFEYGKTLKASLLQIPSRIASRVRAANSDREAMEMMYKEFEALLLSISKGPTQSMADNAKDDFDEDAEKFETDNGEQITGE